MMSTRLWCHVVENLWRHLAGNLWRQHVCADGASWFVIRRWDDVCDVDRAVDLLWRWAGVCDVDRAVDLLWRWTGVCDLDHAVDLLRRWAGVCDLDDAVDHLQYWTGVWRRTFDDVGCDVTTLTYYRVSKILHNNDYWKTQREAYRL
jgi:hypothetical protein